MYDKICLNSWLVLVLFFLFLKVVLALKQFRGDMSLCHEHVRPEQTVRRLLAWNPIFCTHSWCRHRDSYSQGHHFKQTKKTHLQNSDFWVLECRAAKQMEMSWLFRQYCTESIQKKLFHQSTSPMRKGWENWVCPARKEKASLWPNCGHPVPEGSLQKRWREAIYKSV